MTTALHSGLDLELVQPAIGVTLLRVNGELLARTAPDVRRAADAAIDASPWRLVIDLSGVTIVDTAGLMAVTAPAMRARRAAIEVEIVPPAGRCQGDVIERVGVLPILNSAGN